MADTTRRSYLKIGGVVVSAGWAGCLNTDAADQNADNESETGDDWRTLGNDAANTGVSPGEGTDDPSEQWAIEIDEVTLTSPAIVDNTVYIGGSEDGTLYAFDAETGDEQWSYSVDTTIGQTPSATEEAIYVADNQNSVYSISHEGSKEWQADIDLQIASGCGLGEEAVFVSTRSGMTVAFGTDSGEELWREPGGAGNVTPAVVDETVYSFGLAEKWATKTIGVARDADTGEEEWVYEWERDDVIPNHAPVVGKDAVYVNVSSHGILAIDVDSGEEIWVQDVNGIPTQQPVVTDDVLYTGVATTPDDPDEDLGSSVVALETESGDELWQVDVDGTGPSVSKGSELVFQRTFGGFGALEPETGDQIWESDSELGNSWDERDELDEFPEDTYIIDGVSQPVISEGQVLISIPAGGLVAVN